MFFRRTKYVKMLCLFIVFEKFHTHPPPPQLINKNNQHKQKLLRYPNKLTTDVRVCFYQIPNLLSTFFI